MGAREDRLAKNEVLFREVNERVKEVAGSFDVSGRGDYLVDFVCECGRDGCIEQIELTGAEYERVRAEPTWFAVKPGHTLSEVERVVGENERFVTVEKHGAAAERAVEEDPRGAP